MSYATKYKVEWIDYFGQEAELLIEEKDYAGASSDIKGTRSPITLTYDTPSDFLLEPINGSSMTIRLVTQTDFQFSDLYTSNNRKYRVTFNIDSVLFWQGYMLPDQYQEEYKGPPYVNEFIAADQLGYLKTLAWSQGSTISEKEALGIIFTATDLELDIQEGLNVYEENFSSTSADSPLDQTYFDADVFEGKTYYDALYHILFKYCAVLKQRAGEWFIYRPRESTAAYNLRKWTFSGGLYSYDSVQSYNPVVLTTSATTAEASLVRLLPGSMFIRPAWKEYKLTHNLGLREAFNENYDFSSWNGTTLNSWQIVGSGMTYARDSGVVWIPGNLRAPNDKLKIFARNSAPGADCFRSTTLFSGHSSGNQKIKVSIEFDVSVPGSTDIIVYFRLGVNGNRHYDIDTDTWKTSRSPTWYIQKKITNAEAETVLQNEKIEFVSRSFSLINVSYCDFDICIPRCTSTDAFMSINSAMCVVKWYDSVEDSLIAFSEETEYDTTIDADNNYIPDDMEILLADGTVNPYPNAKVIWNGLLYEDAARNTTTYSWGADDRFGSLISLMQNVFTDLFQYPQQVLSVRVYSKLIDSCTILQEINNIPASQKYFMIKRASWEAQEGYWEVEAHQLPFAVSESRILLETGDKILLETGDEIVRE
ncbi:MAG TPA: hypothetical protein VMW53_09815 [archaeon]|nr:hypothetical protein [archaeon]